MTTLELASLIMSVEFALVSAGVLYVVRRRQRHAAQAQGADLQTAVKGAAAERRESLTKLFRSNARLKGRELTVTVEQFMAREQAFYDAMLNIYLNREGKSLKDVPDELRKVLMPWVELQTATSQDSGDIGDLRAENAQLTAQIEHNKEVIERLLEEYDASFSRFRGDKDTQDDSSSAAAAPASNSEPSATPQATQSPERNSDPEPELEESLDDVVPAPEEEEPLEMPESSQPSPQEKVEEELILAQDEDAEELADLFEDSAVAKTKK